MFRVWSLLLRNAENFLGLLKLSWVVGDLLFWSLFGLLWRSGAWFYRCSAMSEQYPETQAIVLNRAKAVTAGMRLAHIRQGKARTSLYIKLKAQSLTAIREVVGGQRVVKRDQKSLLASWMR